MVVLPDLRLLRVFLAVARHRSFTRAGEGLHLTQQSVSEAMRKLEATLGHEVVVRSPRGVELTAAGETLAAELPEALAGLERAIIRTQLAAGRLHGPLAVGCSFDLEDDVRRLLGPLFAAHPDLEPTFSVAAQRDLISALRHRQVDLALTWQLDEPQPDLAVRTLTDEPLVAVFRTGHPLDGDRPEVAVADLAAFPLTMHERDVAPGAYDAMLDQLAAHGVTPRVRHVPIYTSGHRARVEDVQGSDAVALGAARAMAGLGQRGIVVRRTRPALTIEIVCVARREAPFADVLAESLTKLDQPRVNDLTRQDS